MLHKLLRFGAGGTPAAARAANENAPNDARDIRCDGSAHLANIHAFATGAALAVSVDTSPAVLVSIYDYARHLPPSRRRCA